jgi:hypothetical protein
VAARPTQDEHDHELAAGATFAGYRIAGVVAKGATGVLDRATRNARVAFGAGHVWVASLGDGTVTKIRP